MQNVLSINDLPPEILPDYWNDNARINALYSPFRDRTVNARDWDSKLSFWRMLIDTWCNYNKHCVFTELDLKKCFIHNDRVPAGLSIVLNEMYKNKELQSVDDFMKLPVKSWTGWAVDLTVRKPLLWSFNFVKNKFVAPINTDTKFVHLSSIKKLSSKLLNSVTNEKRNKLLTIPQLIENTEFRNVEIETVKLLIHHLYCENKIDMIQLKNEHVGDENELLIKIYVNDKSNQVTEIDIAKYKLEQSEAVLLEKLEKLEQEKTDAMNNVKTYLSKGMRQTAKTCLRKQHEIEKRIDQQANALDNIQTLLARIATAESDGKVLEGYQTGLAALKSVFKDNGLSEDSVADTMLEISEALEVHDDMQSTMSLSVTPAFDAELEEELAELLKEPTPPTTPRGDKPEEEDDKIIKDNLEERLKNLKLPSVPTETPNSSFEKSFQTQS